jgi:DNA polymerase-3 subunit gamma/tau
LSSLYRKWRSRSFEDLVGQEHVVRTLRNAVAQSRVAHAYLFTGPRGTGKTSAARILAKALNCLNLSDGNPCNVCEMCVAANEGRAMDVIEIDAASNTSVENVRDLRERVAYAAGEGRHKVYIVDEVHRLSGAAFDAFLKTLEEPPPHVVFVFASTEPQKVPATIMSRCQRFDFRRISPEIMLARVQFVAAQERIEVDGDGLALVVLNANGSLRDALGLLDQVSAYTADPIGASEVRAALGLADPLLVARMSDALVTGDVGIGLGEIERFMEAGGDPGQLGGQLVEYWRNVLLRVAGAPIPPLAIDPALDDSLQKHAASLRREQVTALLRALAAGDFGTKFNIPSELPLQVGYVEAALALAAPSDIHEARVVESSALPRPVRPSAESLPNGRVSTPPSTGPAADETPAQSQDPPVQELPPPVEMQRRDVSMESASAALEGAWESVVASMRAKSPSLQAILRSGYLMRAEGGELVVGFLYEFHRNAFSDPKKRKLLEEVVAEVLGVPYRVTCIRTTKEEVAAISGSLPEDDGFVEEVSERLREFHAKQLGNGTS